MEHQKQHPPPQVEEVPESESELEQLQPGSQDQKAQPDAQAILSIWTVHQEPLVESEAAG